MMIRSFITALALALVIAACGSSSSTTSSGARTESEEQQVPQPLRRPADASENHIHPNFLYPVTLCGGVGATSKDRATSEYRLQNGSMVVYLKTSGPEVLSRFQLLNGIYPHNADGCVHGRYLPSTVDGRLVFEVEQESIAIAAGGISVSN